MEFTHLHVHSHYSLLDGLPKIPELVRHAKSLSMRSLALTDHGSLYGAIEFYIECQKNGIQPIIGAELYVAPRSYTDKQLKLDRNSYHLVVIAETNQGYHHLLKLVSLAHLEGFYYKPRVDLALLEQYHEGLIALSGCLNGQVARTIVQKDAAAAKSVIERYQQIFGTDNFFLEVQHNPHSPEQTTVNQALRSLSGETGVRLVATADSHYLKPEDAEAQDILVCIHTKQKLSDEGRLSMRNEDYSLASAEQMQEWFADTPEALTTTKQIAERCRIDLKFGAYHMPYYALPNEQTSEQALRTLCEQQIAHKYPAEQESVVRQRLEYELHIIQTTGFASYFLIVQDFVNWAKQSGIVVGPGRGSAAGSIVAYLIGITNIDPLRYGLLFERFLNPERVSMPDIDLDFADTRRDEVIRYVESKYGKDHVAQIITFGTMAARAAVRDVGRVLGLSYGYCDMVAKMIPMFTSLADALRIVPELKELYATDPDAIRLLDGAQKLEGVVRHTSTHACGVVITKEPVTQYSPVQYSSAGDNTIVTQYSLHSVEALGLLKMDFLGLKNLTIIEDTIELIRKTIGQEITIDSIPLNDKRTYRLLQRGTTTGIFQLESAGMKRTLRQLKPSEFEDIIAMVALYRPGPMERISEYIEGKHGARHITYLHPKLESILAKTYGVLVYQEQVMAMVRDIAGFTAGEGYLLIKAVAKKIRSLLDEQKHKFLEGCARNGVAKRVAEDLWAFIEPFASYGFNKSHSTGYALIAYQTAYLKANFPAQFMASLLTSDQENSDRIAIEVIETRELGIEVLPPNINESFTTFTVVKDSLDTGTPHIRFGLAAIKNVGHNLVKAIIHERKTGGPFQSIEDFLSRINHKDLNKKSLESLIKSGALDGVGEPAQLLASLDILLQYSRQAAQEYASGQTSLFSELPVRNAPRLQLVESPVIDQTLRLQWEKELLGLYVTAHPLDKIKNHLPPGTMTLEQALAQKSKDVFNVVGSVLQAKRVMTKNGQPMQFIQIEDSTHAAEVVVFPSAMEHIRTVVNEGDIVRIRGTLKKRNGEQKIIAEEITPFYSHYIRLTLPATTPKNVLTTIGELLQRHPGELPVYVDLHGKTIQAQTSTSGGVLPDLQKLLGDSAVLLV